jgi:hypothetical protein
MKVGHAVEWRQVCLRPSTFRAIEIASSCSDFGYLTDSGCLPPESSPLCARDLDELCCARLSAILSTVSRRRDPTRWPPYISYFAGYGTAVRRRELSGPNRREYYRGCGCPNSCMRWRALHLKTFIILDTAHAGPFALSDLAGGPAQVGLLPANSACRNAVAPAARSSAAEASEKAVSRRGRDANMQLRRWRV